MNRKNWVATLLFAVTLAVGYTSLGDEKAEKMKCETKEAAKDAKEAKAGAQDAIDYAYAQKAEFVAKMKSELAEINAQIDKLSEKVEKAGDADRAEAKAKLQASRDYAARLRKELDDAESLAELKWDDFKSGFKKSYADMKASFNQSRQWLSEKIAP